MGALASNPNSQEAEAGELQLPDQPGHNQKTLPHFLSMINYPSEGNGGEKG